MKPRPFYRWKSFWLGLCVLVFLGWTLFASLNRANLLRWRIPGSLALIVGDTGGRAYVGWGGFIFHHPAAEARADRIPPPITYVASGKRRLVLVAYWFLILLFLVPWSAWLFFHWKREQKKAAFT